MDSRRKDDGSKMSSVYGSESTCSNVSVVAKKYILVAVVCGDDADGCWS